MKINIIAIFLLFSVSAFANQRVRHVEVDGDQIVTVRTSLGVATIIQVPDRPNSVVVGDQDAFKVEYLDQAITIKPLSSSAKSNLYIYTDWKRFNVQLVSGSEAIADYVVYLENAKAKEKSNAPAGSSIKWVDFKNHLKNEGLTLKVNRLGKTKNGIFLVEISIGSNISESFKPEWLWLTQSGATVPIHNLILSSLELSPKKTISGVVQLKESDLKLSEPIRLEIRRAKLSYLTIKKATSWK